MGVGQAVDSLIGVVSPAWGAKRQRARAGFQAVRRFESAVQTRISKWVSGLEAADDELPWDDRLSLLSNVRGLLQNDAHARGAVDYRVNSVVGRGIHVKPKVQADEPGAAPPGKPPISESEAARFNAQMEQAWSVRRRTIDLAGRLDFTGILRLVERRVAVDGDSLLHFVKTDRAAPFQSAVEVIDTDRLRTPIGKGGLTIRDGVQLDGDGRPVAYWIEPAHPTQSNKIAFDAARRVPADEILHIYELTRPGLTRGIPWLATIAPLLRRKKKYAELELLAAIVNSLFCAFIKTEDPHAVQVGTRTDVAADSTPVQEMKAGMVQYLTDGQDVEFGNPTHPNDNYEGYMRSLLQEGAAGLNLAHETFSGDTTHSTFTSMRAKLLEERDMWAICQMRMAQSLCKPLYQRSVEEAVVLGLVDIDPRLYMDRRDDFQRCVVRPPGWRWVDPESEIKAAVMAYRAGLLTLETFFAGHYGADWEEALAQIAQEKKRLAKLGIAIEEAVSAPGEGQPGDNGRASLVGATRW